MSINWSLPSAYCYFEEDWSPVRMETAPVPTSGTSADSPVTAGSYASFV